MILKPFSPQNTYLHFLPNTEPDLGCAGCVARQPASTATTGARSLLSLTFFTTTLIASGGPLQTNRHKQIYADYNNHFISSGLPVLPSLLQEIRLLRSEKLFGNCPGIILAEHFQVGLDNIHLTQLFCNLDNFLKPNIHQK